MVKKTTPRKKPGFWVTKDAPFTQVLSKDDPDIEIMAEHFNIGKGSLRIHGTQIQPTGTGWLNLTLTPDDFFNTAYGHNNQGWIGPVATVPQQVEAWLRRNNGVGFIWAENL